MIPILRVAKRFPAGVWALVGTQLLTAMGFSLALPFVALYLARDRGLPMSVVGIMMFLAAGAGALGQLLGGELADRFGRRPVLLATLIFRVLVFSLLAWLIAEARSLAAILVGYLALRWSGGLALPPVSALVADFSGGKRVEGYSVLRVGTNVGWALGPALGGYLASLFPYAILFLFGAGATSLALLLTGAVREPARPRAPWEKNVLVAFGDPRFRRFLGMCAPVFLVAGQLVSTLSVFTVGHLGLSEAQFGSLLTLNGLLVVLGQYPLARRIQGWPRARALVLGSLLYSLGYLSFGWIRAYPWALLAMAVVTTGEMLFSPVALSVAADLAPEGGRARYFGAFGLVEMFGWSAGAFLGGLLLDHAPSPPVLWLALTALGFLAALFFLKSREHLHRPLQEEPPGAFDQEQGRA